MDHAKMIKPLLIGIAALFALGVAGLPVLNFLPLLLLLACPLMMVLMMAGMHHGGRRDEDHDHSHAGHAPGREP